MKKILITPRSLTKDGDPALDLLTRQGFKLVFSTPGKMPQESELKELLPGCVGYLAGLALDVFDREPLEATPLLSDDRVITTPHIGGYTNESVSRATMAAVENLLEFF